MPGMSRRLKQLENELLALGGEGTMLIEELDGFIAGLLVWSCAGIWVKQRSGGVV